MSYNSKTLSGCLDMLYGDCVRQYVKCMCVDSTQE